VSSYFLRSSATCSVSFFSSWRAVSLPALEPLAELPAWMAASWARSSLFSFLATARVSRFCLMVHCEVS
jgi:hypothetical protein